MIPLIDCSLIAEGAFEDVHDDNLQKFAKELGVAMTGRGMCNLINHGIDMGKIVNILELSRTFFQLPIETKSKYKKVDVRKSFHGYIGPGDERVNEKQRNSTELRESLDIWSVDGHDDKLFPKDEVPDLKSAIDEIRRELENLAKKILRCIEIYLHLDDGTLLSAHKNLDDYSIETQTFIRSLNYYHLDQKQIENAPSDAIRCGEHKDTGTITLLIQDMVGGLEVKTLEGNWLDVKPIENAILINSGHLLEYWTGGRFHAALHRVRIKSNQELTAPRQCFIHFVNPDRGVNVFPLMPVLIDRISQLEKFNNQPTNAYDHFQRLAELAYNKD